MDEATQSQIGWRDLAEAMPGAVGVQVDDEFAYVSGDLASLVDADRESLTGRSWRTLFDDTETTRLEDTIAGVRTDDQWNGMVSLAGVDPPVELTLSAADAGVLVWVFDAAGVESRDLDDRSTGRNSRLYERPEFAHSVLDAIDDILYVVDGNGESHLWNETMVETTGYSHEEIDAMHPTDLLPEDHHECVPELLDALAATDDRRVEVDVLTKSGERIPHECRGKRIEEPESGRVLRCWLARDISDRREREHELERYETIVGTVGDGVYAIDQDLQFTFVNEALCEITGLTRDELLETSALEFFVDDEERADAASVRERVVAAADDAGILEATVPTAGGARDLESHFRLHPEPDGEFRGSVGVIRDVTETRRLESELREQRRFVENVVDALDDVLYVVDESGEFAFWNDELCDRFGYDDEEVSELDPRTFLTPAESDELPPDPSDIVDVPDRHNIVEIATEDGESIPHELRGVTYTNGETGERYRVGIARDVADRLERERTLERQRDELATLDRINELLMETTREVVQTASRGAVERTVCERLAASDLYRFAWVGEPEFDGDRIVPRATAGEDDGYLDAVAIPTDGSELGWGPAGRAMATGEVQVADVADPGFGPWRDAASERGFESAAAVPLQDGGTVYGVLVVYATREGDFSARERAGFDVLGRTVGAIIHAAKNRELLFADSVVELEFRITDPDALFVRAAADLDCELELSGYVSSGERWVLYLDVDDAPPRHVVAAVSDDPRVGRARVIDGSDEHSRIEMVVTASSLLQAVTGFGATVRTAAADSDGIDLVVEAPVDAEIREIVDQLQLEYASSELLARRKRDREVDVVGRPEGPLSDLTERQREVLEAAYRAGYFAWPRDSTAEDVAEALELAAPTLHAHLRKAEAGLLSTLLDSER